MLKDAICGYTLKDALADDDIWMKSVWDDACVSIKDDMNTQVCTGYSLNDKIRDLQEENEMLRNVLNQLII